MYRVLILLLTPCITIPWELECFRLLCVALNALAMELCENSVWPCRLLYMHVEGEGPSYENGISIALFVDLRHSNPNKIRSIIHKSIVRVEACLYMQLCCLCVKVCV